MHLVGGGKWRELRRRLEVHPQLGTTLRKLQRLAHKRQAVLRGGGKPAEVSAALASLTLDGCDVAGGCDIDLV